MRKLLYITLGFAAGCGLCADRLPKEQLRVAMFAALGVWFVLFLFSRTGKGIARLALMAFGCTAAVFWYLQYDNFYLSHAAALDGQTQTASISVSDFSYVTTYGIAFDGSISIDGRSYQVKTYLDTIEAVEPGTVVTGAFRFRLTTPDGAEESPYHPGKGIFLIAYQRGDVTLSQRAPTWRDRIAILRQDIKTLLREAFAEDVSPFAVALLLGDSTELDYAADTAFKLSGIRHVVAVSGLHVSILFALISLAAFRNRFLTVLLGLPSLLLFAALAGFSPSVVRACLMSGLMLLGLLLNREYDGPTALSFAALVMLAVNPLVITSVSFQLSAASVAGIFGFHPSIRRWILSKRTYQKKQRIRKNIYSWFASSVAVSVSATVFTTPLCALNFGMVSLVSVLTNLLTLWVISFVFYGILAVCCLSLLSVSLAALLAKWIAVPIRWVLLVANALGKFPLAAVYTRSPYIVAWLIFVYVLLAVFLLMKKKQPCLLICCGAIGLCLSLLASWAEPMLSEVRFTMLDVGQGQCLLLQTHGQTYMVDCGGSQDEKTADIAAEALLSQGITELDGLIMTHLDRDHAGGLRDFLSRVDTRLMVLPNDETDLEDFTSGEVIYAREARSLTSEDLEIKIYPANFPGNSNEMSLCILFDTEKYDILITGDRNGFGERTLLRYHEIPDVDILVAGHHGSKNSTCEELLQAVQPEIVCISVGQDNSYGHPAPELLQRLQQFGCTVYRTDQQGEILIRR